MRVIFARCRVIYSGRIDAELEIGDRLIIRKDDGAVIVHSHEGLKEKNWMPSGSTWHEEPGMVLCEHPPRGERMESRDLEQAAMAAQLQQQTGGNTAEIFDRVIETVRVRVELQRRVESLTAQGRLARWIVSFMPLGLAGVILVLNPDYLRPLVETGLGLTLLIGSIVMLLVGNLVIGRIVEIEA